MKNSDFFFQLDNILSKNNIYCDQFKKPDEKPTVIAIKQKINNVDQFCKNEYLEQIQIMFQTISNEALNPKISVLYINLARMIENFLKEQK